MENRSIAHEKELAKVGLAGLNWQSGPLAKPSDPRYHELRVIFTRIVAVLVGLTFFVGISECAAICVRGESTVHQDAPPCHDMGHASQPDHSSCPKPLLLAEASPTYAVHVALPVQIAEFQPLPILLVQHQLIRHAALNAYPPRPPRSTAVLLI